MAIERQYNTKQLRAGYRRCTYCGNVEPVNIVCKCSLRLRISGDPETLNNFLAVFGQHFEIIQRDDDFGGGIETTEMYFKMVVKPPVAVKIE